MRHNQLGRTKTQAHSMKNKGYPHHVLMPVNQARAVLAGVSYIATPIAEEGVSLYSFATPDDARSFAAEYGGEPLTI